MSYIDSLISKRIKNTNTSSEDDIFKFEKIKRAKKEAKKNNPSVKLIDMGVGEPDKCADIGVINTLYKEAKKKENRQYADNGIEEYKEAAIKYMHEVYGVQNLNIDTNIVHGIGSKSILAMLPTTVINSGDYSIVTVPGYPIIGTHTEYLGGHVYNLELREENDFLPDLESVPLYVRKRAKLLYLNYPNNPTGAVANGEFFERVVEFAKKNKIIVVHDAAYSAITYDDYKPLSFLEVEGAIDVGVEVHSMSKAFNMTGWRLAFIVGNEKVIDALKKVKDNSDSGQFKAIQRAGIYALSHREITQDINARYSTRLDKLIEILNKVGFTVKKPKGSFYLYVKSPKAAGSVCFKNAEEASEYFIYRELISVVPWDDVGSYLRFSVTFEAENDDEFFEELELRLLKMNLKF